MQLDIACIIGTANGMNMNNPLPTKGRVIGFQDRPLGGTVLRTYRTKADIDDII